MRTLLIIVSGLIWLVICLFAGNRLRLRNPAFWLFIASWLIVATGNLWVGVSQAGYGVIEELPIFLVIFGIPAGIAWLTHRRLALRD